MQLAAERRGDAVVNSLVEQRVRKRQAVRLPRPMIGVLAQDDHAHPVQRGEGERRQPVTTRRIDQLARSMLSIQPGIQRASGGGCHYRGQHRLPG